MRWRRPAGLSSAVFPLLLTGLFTASRAVAQGGASAPPTSSASATSSAAPPPGLLPAAPPDPPAPASASAVAPATPAPDSSAAAPAGVLAPAPPASTAAASATQGDISADPTGPGGGKAPDTTRSKYWAEGDNRFFFATAIDLGYLYLRPRGIIGYGKPFWTWIGFEANPQVSQRFLGGYAGVRGELPFVDLRVGSRYVFSFQQAYLTPRESYGRLELESRELARATYYTLEAELSGAIPLGPGSVLLLGTATQIAGVPKDVYVFDQSLRVVVNPPYVYRGRVGYGIRIGYSGKIGLGLVAEAIAVPDRHTTIIRGGLIATATLSNHLEVIGSFVPPLIGPDTLGTAGGDFGQLGVRYRWATGGANEPIVVPVQF